jgi:hypothetical protein
MSSIPHPSKEQVRAYMHQREFARRPPPTPDEIRRLVGWSGGCDFPSGQHGLFLPGTIAQLAALLAVEWLFLASGAGRPG